MIEMLFILTAIFVAYVIYVVVNEQKTTSKPGMAQAKPENPAARVVKQPSSPPAPKTEKPAEAKPVVTAAAKPEPVAAAPQDTGKRGLKDPKTGEVITTYTNYRFTKRWIKEALVAEGLLDKIYKNDELDAEKEAKIKGAIVKLEAIAKYRA
jgi:hypothetical protein